MFEKYLNNRVLILYLFPLIIGSLSVFSFQPFNFSIINFLILPLSFYLIVFIKKKSQSIYRKKPFRKNLFIFGTSFGFGFYLSGLYWITNALTFDENFRILIPLGLILIPLFLSLFFSLMLVIIGPFLNLNFNSIFLYSAALGFSDYIRAKILTGFPWNLWSYSFSWAIELLQILNKIGLFAFNLVVITLFMSPAFFFLKTNPIKKFIPALVSISLVFLLYIFGNHSINQNKNINLSKKEKFNIKVISPNFELKYGISEEEIEERLLKLARYSEPNKNIRTLFVWPEGVFSGYSYEEILI